MWFQARPEDADKIFEEKKRWDDTVKAKEEDLARIGLDDKKVCPLPPLCCAVAAFMQLYCSCSTDVWLQQGCCRARARSGVTGLPACRKHSSAAYERV